MKNEEQKLKELLNELQGELRNIFGAKLKRIIMYGSYARGSNDEGSDLDIMALVDMDDEEIRSKRDQVLDLTVDLTTRYGVVLSIIENNYDHFYNWVDVVPFFLNVEREGIELYARKN